MLILLLLLGNSDPARWAVNIDAQFDYRPANNQQYGYGFGVGGRRHELGQGALSLWGGLDVFYDQFSSTVFVMSMDASGRPLNYEDAARLTTESFLPMQLLRFDAREWSLELGAGAGLSVVHLFRPFDGVTPTVDHSENDFALRGLVSAAYQFWRDTAVELRFSYTYTYSSTQLSTQLAGAAALYSIGLGAVYRF